jgi:nucleotide-binding universal stress UspA family protein
MNARGSTEVILATIGLAMGVLNQQLFTIIVLMAVVTTLCMPPLLRWALARVPMREEEKARLEKEVEEEKDLVPKLERILVGLDRSENGKLASRLAGWLIGARRLTATVMDVGSATEGSGPTSLPSQDVVESAETAAHNVEARDKSRAADTKRDERDPIDAAAQEAKADKIPVRELISILPLKTQTDTAGDARAEAIPTEARNGYGLLFVGLGARSMATMQNFPSEIEKIVRELPGPIAIALHREIRDAPSDTPLERILVPTTGADYSRFGAEMAVAIAKGCGATITALNISAPPAENELLRRPNQLLRTGRALLGDIVALGEREGVRVMSKAFVGPTKEGVILRQAALGRYQLIVLGTKARSVDQIHFGQSAAALLENASCSILILKS